MAKSKTVLYDDEASAVAAVAGKPKTAAYRVTLPDGAVKYAADSSATRVRGAAALDFIKVELLNPKRKASRGAAAAIAAAIGDMTAEERAKVRELLDKMAS